MSSFGDMAGEDFPHFHNHWQREQDHYRHLHSSDLSAVVSLTGVTMRELDSLSQRQAYSFPFCPRVYKYVITRNQVREGQLSCCLRLLVEHVPSRVSNCSNWETHRRLAPTMHQLLRCLEYLHQRFGPFHITPNMIGWTELGVPKAWVHSNLTASHPEQPAASQQEMVWDLFLALQGSHLLDHLKEHHFSTLSQIRQHFENTPKERWPPLPRKQALTPIDNVSLCQSEMDRPECCNLSHASGCSRKNITFSYSNKDLKINENYVRREGNNKRNSMAAVEDFSHKEQCSRGLALKKEFTYANQESSSMKVIYPLRNTHKKYSFIHNTPPPPPLKVQRLTDYFNKFRPAERQPKRVDVCRIPFVRQKPELLHYSTSTNPYSKFINNKATVDQSASSLDHNDSLHEQPHPNGENKASKTAVGAWDYGKENSHLWVGQAREMWDYGSGREAEVKNDLDALFDSSRGFDQQELEDELEGILL